MLSEQIENSWSTKPYWDVSNIVEAQYCPITDPKVSGSISSFADIGLHGFDNPHNRHKYS